MTTRTARRPKGAWPRFFAAVTAAVALAVGVPLALAALARAGIGTWHPLPGIGGVDEIRGYLDRGLSSTEVAAIAVRTLLVVAWMIWALIVVSALGSFAEVRRGDRLGLPRFGALGAVGVWIAAGLTALSSLTPQLAPTIAAVAPKPFVVAEAFPSLDAAGIVAGPAVDQPAPGFGRVEPGEGIEQFAARTLGDVGRWREVWELNEGRAVGPHGEAWTEVWRLGAGSTLRLPADSLTTATSFAAGGAVDGVLDNGAEADDEAVDRPDPPTGDHLVLAGDSYWAIAEANLGRRASKSEVAGYTAALVAHNAPRLGYDDPTLLKPGDVVELVAGATVSSTPATTPATASADHVYVVEAGDSYWRIAARRATELHGPDGARPTVVYELMLALIELNADRLGHDDPELLHPGDEVWVYDPADAPPETDGDDGPASSGSLPPPAEAPPPDRVAVEQLPPPVTEPAVTEPPATLPPSTAPPVATAPVSSEPVAATGAGGESRGRAPLPIGLGEAALVATGVIALAAARRRARLRAAEPPARLPLPSSSATATERRLRRIGDDERLLRLDIAVRAAASGLVDTDSQIAVARSAGDGSIELLLTAPATLGEPWYCADDAAADAGDAGDDHGGRRWVLTDEVPVDALAEAARAAGLPCVAFTEIGVDEHGWDILVDLEALGMLTVDADDDTADAVVRAFATGLACSEFAEGAHLIGVGVDADAFLGHRLAQQADGVDEAVELAATLVGSTTTADRSTFALRARHTGGETWEPAVVLVAADHATAVTPEVRVIATARRRIAVAVAGRSSAADDPGWVLRPDDAGWWTLQPAAIRLRPVGLDADALVSLREVVEIAPVAAVDFAPPAPVAREVVADAAVAGGGGGAVVAEDALPTEADAEASSHVLTVEVLPDARLDLDTLTAGANGQVDPGANGPNGHLGSTAHVGPGSNGHRRDPANEVAAPPLMVRLIGPVELVDADGSRASFERSKTLELIAWMVTHRDRSTRGAARAALWELDVRDATFANVVSEARRSMARHVAPPGDDEWLRRTMTDELSLHPDVRSDADVIRARMAAAQGAAPAAALEVLRPAVELVRAMPFSDTGYLWPDAEGIVSSLILLATGVAADYGRLALGLGDVDGVLWATERGLTVLAGQESLVSLRMRALAGRGDLAAVRAEWEAYERVLTADPWSDGEPAPQLAQLRTELLGT